LIAGLLAPKSLEFALYAAITAAVAVYGIGRYRSRQSVTTAGVLVGLASAAAAVALIGYTQQPFILNTVALAVSCGLASGLITAAVTAVFLPVCETSFGILTDVKLLELSNADLPALGQLAMRARELTSIRMRSDSLPKTLVASSARMHCSRGLAHCITTSANQPRPNISSKIKWAKTPTTD
jgi:hypothetical protein